VSSLSGTEAIGFDSAAYTYNKSWMIVVPDGLSVKDSIAAAYAVTGNDEAVFPFEYSTTFPTEDNMWSQSGQVMEAATDNYDPDLISGELYSMDTSLEVEPEDDYGFFVGNPNVVLGEGNWLIGNTEGIPYGANATFKMYGQIGDAPDNNLFRESYGYDSADAIYDIGAVGVTIGNEYFIGTPESISYTYYDNAFKMIGQQHKEDTYSLDLEADTTFKMEAVKVLEDDEYHMEFTPAMYHIGSSGLSIGMSDGFIITDGTLVVSPEIINIVGKRPMEDTFELQSSFAFEIGDPVNIGQMNLTFGSTAAAGANGYSEAPLIINVLT